MIKKNNNETKSERTFTPHPLGLKERRVNENPAYNSSQSTKINMIALFIKKIFVTYKKQD